MKSVIFGNRITSSIFGLVMLLQGFAMAGQSPLKILPLGNSITYDFNIEDNTTPRAIGVRISYRYQLYQLLTAAGYTFDYVGSEQGGGDYLPAGYTDNAGFPGATVAELLYTLQSGYDRNGICQLSACPDSYLESFGPDVILLHIGTNGLNSNADADAFILDLDDILDEVDNYEAASGKTVPVFLAQIINQAPNGNHAPTSYYNSLIASLVASRSGDDLIPVNMETGASLNYKLSPAGDMADQYHPEVSGYNKMGNKWFSSMELVNLASPAVSDIPNQQKNEGESFTINLDNYVFDPQEVDADMAWTYSGQSNLSVSINSSRVATITPLNPEWNGSETITFTATDGFGAYNSDPVTFTLEAVADAPVLANIEAGTLSFTEGGASIQVTNTVTVNDADSPNLASATVTISANYQSGADVLTFTPAGSISGSFSAGTLSLSGTDTPANYQTVLRSVRYQNTSEDPTSLTRTLSFQVNDGTDPSNTVTRNISVTPVNDAPVLAGIESSTLSFTEGGASIQVTNTVTVDDVDNSNLNSATVIISANYQSGADVLTFTPTGGITGSFTAGTLSLSGSSTKANYQTVLRSVRYQNTSEDPTSLTRTLSFQVNDGSLNSNTVTRNITVTPVNDAPVLANIETSALSFTEGGASIQVTNTVTVDDADSPNLASATVTISANYQSGADVLTFTPAGGITGSFTAGTLSLSGTSTKANYQTVLRSVRYQNTSENPTTLTRTISFQVYDGALNSNAVTRNITVTSANDAPVLANIETSELSFTEGGASIQLTNTVTVDDADSPNLASATVTISANYQSGADVLTFTPAGGITGSFTAGTLSLSGTSTQANYQTVLRSVRYQNTSEDPTALTRTISFQVNDGSSASNTVARNINVTAVNDKPIVAGIEAGPLSYNQGDGEVQITATITVSDVDNTTFPSSGNTVATVQITGGLVPAEDRLVYSTTSGIVGNYSSGTGLLTLTGTNKSALDIRAALRAVKYQNIAGNPTSGIREVTFIVNDGQATSDPVSRDITLNTAPVLANMELETIIYCRNTGKVPVTSSLTLTDGDDDFMSAATVRISSGYVNGQDVLSYTAAGGISGSFNASTGILNLSGVALKAEYIQVLKSIRYENTQTVNPTSGIRVIAFTVNDGKTNSNIVSRNLNVTVPTAALTGTATICEHTSANLSVALTGNSPWKFSYRHGSEDPVEVLNVASSPRLVSVGKEGTYTLVEVTDVNSCTGIVSGSANITVTQAPVVTITGLEPAYNLNTIRDDFSFSPSGGSLVPRTYLIQDQGIWYFYPIIAQIGTHNVICSYQDPGTLCYGYDTAVVRVLVADADIVFPDDRQFYCGNDRPFLITGVNTVNDIGSFAIEGGVGLTDNHDNTATIDPALLGLNTYTITYTYFDGTTLQVNEDLTIGNKPVADFKWETECFQAEQAINLNDNSTSNQGSITNYKWLFHFGSGYDSLITQNVTYTYDQPGNYVIEHQIKTSNGCTDTVVKVFGLRPTIKLIAGQTYFEDFEDSPISWRSGTSQQITQNSWSLGAPTKGFSGASSGDNCWFTYIPTANAPSEQSYVSSPCFDFTETEKPMIKMEIWRLFNATRNGATLQASADSGKTWLNIGEPEDGINWYNGYYANYNIGWTNARDAGWLEARHSLDDFIDKPEVQFRIVYASDGTALNTDGIAFDDIWIGERDKHVLIEHFTNSSDQASKDANLMVNELVSQNKADVIDLQYHTSFPEDDPFNADNPYIPGARLLYYGLSNVPYSILDGGSIGLHKFDYDLRLLDEKTVLIQSLLDSKFSLSATSTIVGNSLNVNTKVTANENIGIRELTLHMVVIERHVTGITGENGETEFYSVVKTMLPDAGGTTFYQSWAKGENQYVDHSWNMGNIYDLNELRVVTFIQDESTNEVYQASMDTVEVQTAIEDPFQRQQEEPIYIVYPDPASSWATLRFSDILKQDITLEVINNLGVVVYATRLPAGEVMTEFPVMDLPDGIYLIRLTGNLQILGTSRLTISK